MRRQLGGGREGGVYALVQWLMTSSGGKVSRGGGGGEGGGELRNHG